MITGTTAGGGAFNGALHPRVAAGSAGGGRFAAKNGGSSSSSAPKKAAPQPNGLGYSSAQWKQLQQLEAKAKSGQKLDAHEQHLLHVAHEKRLKAMAKPAPKPKAKAKPKTAKKTTAKKK